jgi:ferredoxin
MHTMTIDESLCAGFGDCSDLAPDLIELDRHGKALLQIGRTPTLA